MIRSLRNSHLQIWLVLAGLLPAGIIMAWLVVPLPAHTGLLQPAPSAALPVILKQVSLEDRSIAVRCSADSLLLQLEWKGSTGAGFPPALIYRVNDSSKDIADGVIVGRVDSRGTYHFPLQKDPAGRDFHFIVYDIIHHKIIQRVNL